MLKAFSVVFMFVQHTRTQIRQNQTCCRCGASQFQPSQDRQSCSCNHETQGVCLCRGHIARARTIVHCFQQSSFCLCIVQFLFKSHLALVLLLFCKPTHSTQCAVWFKRVVDKELTPKKKKLRDKHISKIATATRS